MTPPSSPPWAQQGSSLFARIPASLVNPKRPETLQPYLAELHDKLVLRIKCPLSSVVWSTPELGQLRKAAITALAPGQEVSRLMASRLDRIRDVAGQAGFIGLHLRIEQDWVEHCRTQPANPEKTQVETRLPPPPLLLLSSSSSSASSSSTSSCCLVPRRRIRLYCIGTGRTGRSAVGEAAEEEDHRHHGDVRGKDCDERQWRQWRNWQLWQM